jgi:hypothetical protein
MHRLLAANAEFETGWTPLDQVERGLGLDIGHSPRAVVRYDVTPVKKRNSHVLAIARITDDHLVFSFEACQTLSMKGTLRKSNKSTYTGR